MAYNALFSQEHEDVLSDVSTLSSPTSPRQTFQSLSANMENMGTDNDTLFMEREDDNENDHDKVDQATYNTFKKRERDQRYKALDTVEDENDDEQDAVAAMTRTITTNSTTTTTTTQSDSQSQSQIRSVSGSVIDSAANIKQWRRSRKLSNQFGKSRMGMAAIPPLIVPKPMRSASIRSVQLSPTADLHGLQASIITNVEHLEQTAEQMSRASSIDNAIRQLHQQQKRSDSRPSSRSSSSRYHHPPLARQSSNTQSILDLNNTARSGGFSPGGYAMVSPRASFASIRGRSSSKGSRFGSRPEPELEGRPLDAFVSPSTTTNSPIISRTASIAEQDETATTPKSPPQPYQSVLDPTSPNALREEVFESQLPTPQSTQPINFENRMFDDFDGQHYAPSLQSRHGSMIDHPRTASDGNTHLYRQPLDDASLHDRRSFSNPLSGNRRSVARPLSYADPSTGMNMVYYPAPVPTMLNLPPKLSNRHTSTNMDKRRTQILSSMLPNVFEDNVGEMSDEEHLPLSEHRKSILRKSAAEHGSLPPQLRASVFFDYHEKNSEPVAIKDQSAVATLDSILDASAFAPVNAHTDHTYGVPLGAEVYGKRSSRFTNELTNIDKRKTLTKRLSSNTLLTMRRSSTNLLVSEEEELEGQQKRRSTLSSMFGVKKFANKSDMGDDEIGGHAAYVSRSAPVIQDEEEDTSEEEEEDDPEQEGQFNDEEYYGPPTTLLAELRLRKHQAKQRTRPTALKRPDGTSTTFMERETVAQIENKNRAKKRVNLAWEDPNRVGAEELESDDEDVPLGVIYQAKDRQHDVNRPIGLLELKDMEDNEPLSRRRNRLQGLPVVVPRSAPIPSPSAINQDLVGVGSNTIDMSLNIPEDSIHATTQLSSDLLSQYGGEGKRDVKGKGKEIESKIDEEEETLGQRRKRLQAEAGARAKEVNTQAGSEERPPLKKGQSSMANILQAHPDRNGGMRASSYGNGKQLGGLLGMHEQAEQVRRSTTMIDTHAPTQQPRPYPQMLPSNYGAPGTDIGSYSMQQNLMPHPYHNYGPGVSYAQPTVGGAPMANGWYAANGMHTFNNPMAASMMQLQIQMDQFEKVMQQRQAMTGQRQAEMVERWRRSVAQ